MPYTKIFRSLCSLTLKDLNTKIITKRLSTLSAYRVKVEEKKDLERDMKSNAIVNTNKSAYELAKRRAKEAQKERDNLRDVTREVNEIKCEMHDIKNMLTQLLEK